MKYALTILLMLLWQTGIVCGQPPEAPAPAAESPAPAALSPLVSLLAGKTLMLKGEKLVPGECKRNAEYIIFYYGAGRCPSCRMSAPHNIELYNKLVKDNPAVELVLCNMDRTREAAEKWAREVGMPCLILLQNDFPEELKHLRPYGIPVMVLADKSGKVIMRSQNMEQLIKAAK